MDLNKLYEKQAELDKHILEKHNIKMSKEELLDNTILALLVEVGELANTTRCFKHWSIKGMMDKEIMLSEYADCLHFYLSIGNQIGEQFDIECVGWYEYQDSNVLTKVFRNAYKHIDKLDRWDDIEYLIVGDILKRLASLLNFTDEEVEQAYLKKHEENYKRQREGY